MNKTYICILYATSLLILILSIIFVKKMIFRELFIKPDKSKVYVQEFIRKHNKKLDIVLKVITVIGFIVLYNGLIIPVVKDVPYILNNEYKTIEGKAVTHSYGGRTDRPIRVTIRDDNGNEERLVFFFWDDVYVGDRFKIIYLPKLKRGTVLKSEKNY